MLPLLERGREALRTYIRALPDGEGPIGGARSIGRSIDIVTHDDFCKHAALVMRHVIHNRSPTHILCADGALCALIESRPTSW